jgi:hypothetical protein
MSEVKFVLRGEPFQVGNLAAHQACDALTHGPHPMPCCVKSNVTVDVLKSFVSAIEGETIELTNENLEGLSTLSDEFQFRNLSKRIVLFKNTEAYRLWRLEKGFA